MADRLGLSAGLFADVEVTSHSEKAVFMMF